MSNLVLAYPSAMSPVYAAKQRKGSPPAGATPGSQRLTMQLIYAKAKKRQPESRL